MKNLLGKFEDRMFLRVATVLTALLFIPAFMYGAVSIWSVIFAALLAFLFNSQLRNIVLRCGAIEDDGKRCGAVIGRYFWVVLEMTLVASTVPIFFLYSGVAVQSVVGAFDAQFLDYSPLSLLVEKPYVSSALNIQILIAATAPLFISFILSLVLSFKKSLMLANMVMYLKAERGRVRHSIVAWAWYDAYSSFGAIGTMFIVIFYSLAIQASSFSILSASFLIWAAYFLLFMLWGVLFTAMIAFQKS